MYRFTQKYTQNLLIISRKLLTNAVMLTIILMLHSCALPYKKKFDCPVGKGEYCKSLYDVNKIADTGYYSPNNHEEGN